MNTIQEGEGAKVDTFNKFSALKNREWHLVVHSDQEQEEVEEDMISSKSDGETVTRKIKEKRSNKYHQAII